MLLFPKSTYMLGVYFDITPWNNSDLQIIEICKAVGE